MAQDIWLDGFTRTPVRGMSGGSFTHNTPWKVCIHTIEGTTAGALAMYRKGTGCPHFTVSLRRGVYLQHIPINRSAYALRNASGGTETNRDNVIQIELEGYANASHAWPLREYMNLAFNVLEPIMNTYNIPVRFAPTTGSAGSGLNGVVRFGADEWDDFNGVLGHANVPENTHWDPGMLNTRLLTALLEKDASMGYFEKYSDPEVGAEYIVSKNPDEKIIFRRFSQPRGDGTTMAGLDIVLGEWKARGYVEETS